MERSTWKDQHGKRSTWKINVERSTWKDHVERSTWKDQRGKINVEKSTWKDERGKINVERSTWEDQWERDQRGKDPRAEYFFLPYFTLLKEFLNNYFIQNRLFTVTFNKFFKMFF